MAAPQLPLQLSSRGGELQKCRSLYAAGTSTSRATLSLPLHLQLVSRRVRKPQCSASGTLTSSIRQRALKPLRASADPASEVIEVTATTTELKTPAERLLGDITFIKASTGESVPALSLWPSKDPSALALLCFFTHFGDLTTSEYSQLITRKILPEITNVSLACIGLGSVENAKKFCELFDFPLDLVYCDPTGETYQALGLSPGFAPETPVNPYLKLLPMLAGIGSPGTIQEVLRGYVGDRQRSPIFGGSTPFDVLGAGYQRPFELATQRLFNMNTVLSNWGQLAPAKESLLTQQGGTIVFKGGDDIFLHKDTGILMYANVDKVLETLKAAQSDS